ncbi:flagellar biosynthesis anti-sigma factor FlgM [Bacillus sp. FJAT-27251]|uniref:flagellar biosynthesis anti-sigma factor FlgM n=1 Tax=Bacillus sp. FJAT-27251 TaxID=1684142 RepID=UPI0006A7BDA4|nr:flagellar biosynthesis anti-sigma factor FlgM [Bacillus sp. FJAT-27251]
MNIDKSSGPFYIQPYQKQTQVSKVEKTKPVQNEDQLQISQQAKEMFEKKGADPARQEKIKALKAQIQSGEYQVSPEQVANKVFKFWFDK